MSGLLDLANRLERASERVAEVTVHAMGDVIGGEMLQYFEGRRYTGRLADTLDVAEETQAVAFKSRHYRQYLGYFSRGIPRPVMERARAAAERAVAALFGEAALGKVVGAQQARAHARAAQKVQRARDRARASAERRRARAS